MRPLAAALLALALAGCKTPTEDVLRFETMGGAPAQIQVHLTRSTPFNNDPKNTPANVEAALDGADLDLFVQPQGGSTSIALLPGSGNPLDLTVEVSAAGFEVAPSGPQDGTFMPDSSRELDFTLTALPPDGGARDMRGDGGRTDGAAPRG
jgi:hypothetical protein